MKKGRKAKVIAKRGHELTPTRETFWAENFGKCKKRGKNAAAPRLSSIDPHLLPIEASFSAGNKPSFSKWTNPVFLGWKKSSLLNSRPIVACEA